MFSYMNLQSIKKDVSDRKKNDIDIICNDLSLMKTLDHVQMKLYPEMTRNDLIQFIESLNSLDLELDILDRFCIFIKNKQK